jgi:hypothetical protein
MPLTTAQLKALHDKAVSEMTGDIIFDGTVTVAEGVGTGANEMTQFTVQSWNNCNPQHFELWGDASAVAKARAARENAVVHVLDNLIDEACEVDSAGNIGKWMTADPA